MSQVDEESSPTTAQTIRSFYPERFMETPLQNRTVLCENPVRSTVEMHPNRRKKPSAFFLASTSRMKRAWQFRSDGVLSLPSSLLTS